MMKGTSAILIAKANVPGLFTKGKQYRAIYELHSEDQGWFTMDDREQVHWMSPYDGKNHQDIHKEAWITTNFIVVSVR